MSYWLLIIKKKNSLLSFLLFNFFIYKKKRYGFRTREPNRENRRLGNTPIFQALWDAPGRLTRSKRAKTLLMQMKTRRAMMMRMSSTTWTMSWTRATAKVSMRIIRMRPVIKINILIINKQYSIFIIVFNWISFFYCF